MAGDTATLGTEVEVLVRLQYRVSRTDPFTRMPFPAHTEAHTL